MSAHRCLHEEAYILHRDIIPRKIMINIDGPYKNRGFLTDFDHALKIPSESEYVLLGRIVGHPSLQSSQLTASQGTERFISSNVLHR